jgi:hypothetical protein
MSACSLSRLTEHVVQSTTANRASTQRRAPFARCLPASYNPGGLEGMPVDPSKDEGCSALHTATETAFCRRLATVSAGRRPTSAMDSSREPWTACG